MLGIAGLTLEAGPLYRPKPQDYYGLWQNYNIPTFRGTTIDDFLEAGAEELLESSWAMTYFQFLSPDQTFFSFDVIDVDEVRSVARGTYTQGADGHINGMTFLFYAFGLKDLGKIKLVRTVMPDRNTILLYRLMESGEETLQLWRRVMDKTYTYDESVGGYMPQEK